MTTVFLGIGSNVEPDRNIRRGLDALESRFDALRVSPAYRSPSFGFDGPDFINLVASIETGLSPLELKGWLRKLEQKHGRSREVPRFSDRTLDVDILLYGDLWLRSPTIEIPREEIYQAAYVLRPLADLAPDLTDPLSGKAFEELWRGFQGDAELQPVEIDKPL